MFHVKHNKKPAKSALSDLSKSKEASLRPSLPLEAQKKSSRRNKRAVSRETFLTHATETLQSRPLKVLFHVKRSPVLEAKRLKSRPVNCFT